MITVETNDPVKFSNLTSEERKARRSKRRQRVQSTLQKADESGILTGVKNWLLGSQQATDIPANINVGSGGNVPVNTANDKKPMNPALKWGLILGGTALAIFIGYKVIKGSSKGK
jgi:hypothetical protein